MPRIHFVKKARKARRQHGIRKGDAYYWWWNRYAGTVQGFKRYSKTRPRPSQTTLSPYLSICYQLQERVEDLGAIDSEEKAQEAITTLEEVAAELEELKEETEEKRDNVGEAFNSEGATYELLSERCENLDNLITELDTARSELESIEWEGEDEDSGTADSILSSISWEF